MPEAVGDPALGRVGNGVGRSAHFQSGFYAVRSPAFRPITPIGFRPTSVMHQMMSSGTGYSEHDKDRFLMGDHLFSPSLPTMSGQAEGTYQKSVWLRQPHHIPADVLNGGSDGP